MPSKVFNIQVLRNQPEVINDKHKKQTRQSAIKNDLIEVTSKLRMEMKTLDEKVENTYRLLAQIASKLIVPSPQAITQIAPENLPTPPLTTREQEILRLIACGNSCKDIAALLSISLKTAENHRKNIMNKLDIHNTAGLVHYAIRYGIVPLQQYGSE